MSFPQAGADPRVLDRMIDVAMSIWSSTLLRDSGLFTHSCRKCEQCLERRPFGRVGRYRLNTPL